MAYVPFRKNGCKQIGGGTQAAPYSEMAIFLGVSQNK